MDFSKLTNFTNGNDDSFIQRDQGFFCSELIAAAYKKLGLLPKDRPACKYWPGNFSTE